MTQRKNNLLNLVLYTPGSFVLKSNIVFTFIGQVRDELKKVTWPTRAEVIRLTSIVLIVSFLVGIYLGIADTVFTKLLQYLI